MQGVPLVKGHSLLGQRHGSSPVKHRPSEHILLVTNATHGGLNQWRIYSHRPVFFDANRLHDA